MVEPRMNLLPACCDLLLCAAKDTFPLLPTSAVLLKLSPTFAPQDLVARLRNKNIK